MRIRLRFSVKVAKINNYSPTIYGVLVCRWRFWDCKCCTALLAGHTTLKPTNFPEISFNYFSDNLMFLSMVLIGALFLLLVPLTKLDESFTELSTDWGVLDYLARKGCVLPFLGNLFSSPGTQLSVHLITRNHCRKNSGDLLRLGSKNLLTDVWKKINCLLKVGGWSTSIPEIIFVIQLLKRVIDSFHTRFFRKKTLNLRRDLKFFFALALKILFNVDRIGEEGDEADPFDDGSP